MADTSSGPYAGASGGSKVTYTVGKAVAAGGRGRTREAARGRFGRARDRAERPRGRGRRRPRCGSAGPLDLRRGHREEHVPLRRPQRAGRRPRRLCADKPRPLGRGPTSPTSSVDRETGEVELLGYVIIQDVGRALNPALVEGQMRGGAAQAIGWALYEELAHDEDGRLAVGLVPRLRDPDGRPHAAHRHGDRRGARARLDRSARRASARRRSSPGRQLSPMPSTPQPACASASCR